MSDEGGQNESNGNHSENIEDSESEEEKKIRIILNITINGKEIPLKIYDDDNFEQKIKEFCQKNNLSSKAQQDLLRKVEEELEHKSNGSENISNKSDNYYSNKIVREPKDTQTFGKSISFKPKEKNRLEHIFNESESVSLSESLNQSHNNLDNLIREYNNEGNDYIYNQNKGKNVKNVKIKNNIFYKEDQVLNNKEIDNKYQQKKINNDLTRYINFNNRLEKNKLNSSNNLNNITNFSFSDNSNKYMNFPNENNNIDNLDNIDNSNNNSITINKYKDLHSNDNSNHIVNNLHIKIIGDENNFTNINSESNDIPLGNNLISQKESKIQPQNETFNQTSKFIDNNDIPRKKAEKIIKNINPKENNIKYYEISKANEEINRNNNPNEINNINNNYKQNESIIYNKDPTQTIQKEVPIIYYMPTNGNNNYNNLYASKAQVKKINVPKAINNQYNNYNYINNDENNNKIKGQIRSKNIYNGTNNPPYENNKINNENQEKYKIDSLNNKKNKNSNYRNQSLQNNQNYKQFYNDLSNIMVTKIYPKNQRFDYINSCNNNILTNYTYPNVNKINNLYNNKIIGINNNNKPYSIIYSNNSNNNPNNNSNLSLNLNNQNNQYIPYKINNNMENVNQFPEQNVMYQKELCVPKNLETIIYPIQKEDYSFKNTPNYTYNSKENNISTIKTNKYNNQIPFPNINNLQENNIEIMKKNETLNYQYKEKNMNINDNMNEEIKEPEKKRTTDNNNLQKDSVNDISKETNIIIKDNIEDKEPQDNSKMKKLNYILPKDTDEDSEDIIPNANINSINKDNRVVNNKFENENNNIKREESINKINTSIKISNNDDKSNNIINSYNNNYDNNNYKEKNNNIISSKNNDLKDISDNYSPKIAKHSIKNDLDYSNIEKIDEYSEQNDQISNYLKRKNNDNYEISKSNSFIINSNKIADSKSKKFLETRGKKNIYSKKKPLKVLSFVKYDTNYINNRNNSAGANNRKKSKIKFAGERLYEQHMKKLQQNEQNIKMNEILNEENKEMIFHPKINENSRRIVEELRNKELEEDKVEDRLINYGNNKKQKHIIQHANSEIRNKTQSPFRPKINSNSRILAEKNKKNRINEIKNIIENKNKKILYKKKISKKDFEISNRSIGNDHKNKKSFISYEDHKKMDNDHFNINNLKNRIRYRNNTSNISNDDDNNSVTMSNLNKTVELNKAYNELYNSIDEKKDSDISRYFGNYSPDLTDTREKTKSNVSCIQNRNITPKRIKSVTPSRSTDSYSTFDFLYYQSEKIDEKHKIEKESKFKKNHPFKPKISPNSIKINNERNESTKDFIKRINNNIEEIKIINSSNIPKVNKIINRRVLAQQNLKKDLGGEKSPNRKRIKKKCNEVDEIRIKNMKKELERIKSQEGLEKKNIYNQKSENIIIKLKYKKYKELFDLLDSNNDGFISSSKILLTKVDENILKNISPILEELNETNKQMDFNEFRYKVDKLMSE